MKAINGFIPYQELKDTLPDYTDFFMFMYKKLQLEGRIFDIRGVLVDEVIMYLKRSNLDKKIKI